MTQLSVSQASREQNGLSTLETDLPVWKTVLLHLLPGLLALVVFVLIARPVESMGYPSMMAWLISVSLTLIPFELGYLYYQGIKRNGRPSLEGVILYRQHLSAGKVILWTALTFLVLLILFLLTGPLTNYLETVVFAWVPDWFMQDTGLEGGYGAPALLVLNIASIFVFVIAVPVVEEMYFRGFLLPRLAHLGTWSILINSFLFALYHFTTPWGLAFRTLMIVPLAYSAYRTKSILPAIIVHAIVNSVDVIMGFVYILNM